MSYQNRIQANFDHLCMAMLMMKTTTISKELRCQNEVEESTSYCACDIECAQAKLEAFMVEGKELDSSLYCVNQNC